MAEVIESKLKEISSQWEGMMFDFGTWKGRDYPCVLSGAKVGETQEVLEETMMNLNTMNAWNHRPFKPMLLRLRGTQSPSRRSSTDCCPRSPTRATPLSDGSRPPRGLLGLADGEVQQMWTSLESVFTGGDIAKAMPMEVAPFKGFMAHLPRKAKKFQQIDKDWLKIMQCPGGRGFVGSEGRCATLRILTLDMLATQAARKSADTKYVVPCCQPLVCS